MSNSISIDDTGTVRYFHGNLLVGVMGTNSHGKLGQFFDTKNGLCPHEQVRKWCGDCKCKPRGTSAVKAGDAIPGNDSHS